MDTRAKLEEATYFLERLTETQDKPETFNYNLSALLSAWRSVLDIMLYDFSEHYSLGLTREDKITHEILEIAAKALRHNQALAFIRWWRQKQGRLKENPLWQKRTLIVHRGYPETTQTYRFYVTGSGGTSITVSGIQETPEFADAGALALSAFLPSTPSPSLEVRFTDFPDRNVPDMCTQALYLMQSVVQEAEEMFHIEL